MCDYACMRGLSSPTTPPIVREHVAAWVLRGSSRGGSSFSLSSFLVRGGSKGVCALGLAGTLVGRIAHALAEKKIINASPMSLTAC